MSRAVTSMPGGAVIRRERCLQLAAGEVGVTDLRPSGEWQRGQPGRSSAVVLLHGFTGRRGCWEHVDCALARERRVVAVDLPGHGETVLRGDGVATMDDAAAMLDEALVALGVESCTLVGYSLGGRLALCYTLAFPGRVRRLVLEGVRPGLAIESEREARRRADEELADFIIAEGIEAFVARWEATPVLAGQHRLAAEVRARVRAERLSQEPARLAASLRGMGVGVQPWLGQRLSLIRIPVLLVTGADDELYCDIATTMAAALPRASIAVVAGAGHTVHLERPTEFIRLLREFAAPAESVHGAEENGRQGENR